MSESAQTAYDRARRPAMNGQTMIAKMHSKLLLPLILLLASGAVMAQVPVDEQGKPIATYNDEGKDSDAPAATTDQPQSTAALEELVGPVALYPDDLLAIVLPASTYPLEVVQAARFIERLKTDSSLKPDENWDESVVALLNYPEVVQMMDGDIDWTWRLGEAVINQQSDVIAAVEAFRDRAYAAGNLKTDEYQTVSKDDGIIEIIPIDEEIIYVPYYEPAEVVVYQPRPAYNYYPTAYPSYYYPYPIGHQFNSGYFWGVTTAFSIGWGNNYLNVFHPSYWGHPYYGRSYYGDYYRNSSFSVFNSWYGGNGHYSSQYRYRNGDQWRPRSRAGSRQHEPSVRNYNYPPGSDRRRGDHGVTNDQLNNRRNGRSNSNVRERNQDNRQPVTANNSRRAGFASSSDRARQTASSNHRSTANTSDRNRLARSIDADNRGRVATDRTRSAGSRARNNSTAPAIRFRDRSNQVVASTNRNSLRSSSNHQAARPQASSRPNRAVARPTQRQGRVAIAARQEDRVRSTPRSSQSRQVPQRVAPTQRVTAPRASPTRVQRRTQAPRASAPSSGRRVQSAPGSSHQNSSSGRSQSAGSSRSRSSGSSRGRSSGSSRGRRSASGHN
jgi:uncharacterized protein DUF3300